MGAKRFAFRLEPVRALREQAEDEAKEHLAGAIAERQQWALRRVEAARRLDDARHAQRATAGTGGVSIGGMLAHQAFLERAEREERAAEMDLHRQDAEVEARRTALQEAARERQVLEKLKERALTDHRARAARAEGNMLDELALGVHARRRSGAFA